MRSILLTVVVVALFAAAAPSALAKNVPPMKGAQLHQIIGNEPGKVEVVGSYDRAIKLQKIDKDHVGYWNPDGGKYIVAGDYAYIWCKVFNVKNASDHYGWVAVNTPDLHKAMDLATTLASGVAFYKITTDNGKLVMEAYPYQTIHAMAQGQPIVDVHE